MAPINRRPQGKGLSAGIEERFLVPLTRNVFAARTWFSLAVVVGLVLHVALISWFLWRDRSVTDVAKQEEETPVEVIVEPPKAPEQPKAAAEKAAQPKIEKPATSAPRAPQEQEVETAALDKETHAPKADAPLSDGQSRPEVDPGSPEDAAPVQRDTEEQAAEKKADVLEKDKEALDIATPEPPRKPEKAAKAKPPMKQKRDKTALRQVSGDIPLPAWAFARAGKRAPIYGGSEDDRYLSEVFGFIMHQYRDANVPDPTASVTLDFQLGDDGSVVAIRVSQSSGYEEMDAAALAAVLHAAPFPPLPPGSPHGLTARISAASHHEDYTLGER